MTNERFIELFDKSRSGDLSESEAYELNEWIGQSAHNREMFERLQDEVYLKRTVNQLAKARLEDWQNILEKIPELRSEGALIKRMSYRRLIRISIPAAAAIILIAFTTYWLVNNKTTKQKPPVISKTKMQEVRPPDITKARITLANGQVVALDTFTSGVLAMQGKVHVLKTSDGQIAYKGAAVSGKPGEVAYNTLANPRGSKVVSISLSDGTTIWLNSESTLRYPVVFNGNERSVTLSGEAYFEVAPSFVQSGKKRPFFVTANKVTVEVLGTHFNVNNYIDESALKVTLLEGSVRVKSGDGGQHSEVMIKPGEQAVLANNSSLTIDHSADLEKAMAWKNGAFYFNGETLEAIMKQLARYYNIEVEYEGNVPEKRFGGMINRNKNLGEVLNVLELSGVHFRMEGKKIIVLK
jgi:ferric-dicitrate binding protein FerR (iron transport regulator)